MQKYEHSDMVFNASIKIPRLKKQTFIDIMLLQQLNEMVWPYYLSVLFFVIHVYKLSNAFFRLWVVLIQT